MKKSILIKLISIIFILFLVVGNICINFAHTNIIVNADSEEEELENKKEEAYTEIRNYVDPDDYEEPDRTNIINFMNEFCMKIKLLDDEGLIEYYLTDFYNNMSRYIQNSNPESLDDIKYEAYEHISRTISGSDIYYVFQEEIDEFLRDIRTEIDQASSEEEVENLIKLFDDKMAEYPTDIDVYLANLKYNLVESFIDYIGVSMHELQTYLDDGEVDYLIENFEDELRYLSVYEKIMEAYNGSINYVYNRLHELKDGYFKVPQKDIEKNPNIGLIIACSVEGAVILLGGILFVCSYCKRRKNA